jgi:hypothetical protein
LIENHLLMASISSARPDDPLVIRNPRQGGGNSRDVVARRFTSRDAQMRATNSGNGFKDALLWSLHNKAMPLFTGGTEFIRAEEKHRELLMDSGVLRKGA